DSGDAMVISSGGELGLDAPVKKKKKRRQPAASEETFTAVHLSADGQVTERTVFAPAANAVVPAARVSFHGDGDGDGASGGVQDLLGWTQTPFGFVGMAKTKASPTPACRVFAPQGASKVSADLCPRLAALPGAEVRLVGDSLFSIFEVP